VLRGQQTAFWETTRYQETYRKACIELAVWLIAFCRVPSRRLDDRIRELCAKAVTAQDSELDAIFSELNGALHEHNERLRKLAADKLAGREKKDLSERRSR
jgi:hypothetical protein